MKTRGGSTKKKVKRKKEDEEETTAAPDLPPLPKKSVVGPADRAMIPDDVWIAATNGMHTIGRWLFAGLFYFPFLWIYMIYPFNHQRYPPNRAAIRLINGCVGIFLILMSLMYSFVVVMYLVEELGIVAPKGEPPALSPAFKLQMVWQSYVWLNNGKCYLSSAIFAGLPFWAPPAWIPIGIVQLFHLTHMWIAVHGPNVVKFATAEPGDFELGVTGIIIDAALTVFVILAFQDQMSHFFLAVLGFASRAWTSVLEIAGLFELRRLRRELTAANDRADRAEHELSVLRTVSHLHTSISKQITGYSRRE